MDVRHETRGTDTKEDPSWSEIVGLRRVRQSDNGDDALALQAQRCLRQFKAYSFRTTVTIVATAGMALATGMYVYVTDVNQDVYKEISQMQVMQHQSLQEHRHDELVRLREVDQLREHIMEELSQIHTHLEKITGAHQQLFRRETDKR